MSAVNDKAHRDLADVLCIFSKFSAEEIEAVTPRFKMRLVRKNDMLLRSGDICTEFYYVHSGVLRIYLHDKNGNEKTRYIMLDHYIGTALASFIDQAPSVEAIEATEDSTVLHITHEDFFTLTKTYENWRKLYQKILEMAYTFQTRRFEQLTTMTAAQRYDHVLRHNPKLIQNVSNRILASYLDVREETLSRLKGK